MLTILLLAVVGVLAGAISSLSPLTCGVLFAVSTVIGSLLGYALVGALACCALVIVATALRP